MLILIPANNPMAKPAVDIRPFNKVENFPAKSFLIAIAGIKKPVNALAKVIILVFLFSLFDKIGSDIFFIYSSILGEVLSMVEYDFSKISACVAATLIAAAGFPSLSLN